MKNNIHDIFYALIYIAIGVLGWISVFIIIPLGCRFIYPIFGFAVSICISVIVSWLVLTNLIMFTLAIAEMFFKK